VAKISTRKGHKPCMDTLNPRFLKSCAFVFFLFSSLPVNAEEKSKLVNSSDSFVKRQNQEEQASGLRYSFIAHKPSFILPLTYSFKPNPEGNGSLEEVDNIEIKFQFSFKVNLVESFFDHFRLSFGYTNLSFWQFYNNKTRQRLEKLITSQKYF